MGHNSTEQNVEQVTATLQDALQHSGHLKSSL